MFKRKSDRARGKAGRWTCWFKDDDGRVRQFAGVTDKAKSLELANAREAEAMRVREGLADPGDRARREASLRSVADHVEDYRRGLLAKGDTPRHAARIAHSLLRVLQGASVESVAEIVPSRVQEALGRLRVTRSARTCNHDLGAVKAFASWLQHDNRIKEVPRGLLALKPYNEASDRRLVRRALTEAELARLLAAADAGPTLVASRGPRAQCLKDRGEPRLITGPERAALYRLAMGTGFRADELRTLTPERFHLDGDSPTITVLACYSKNGKEAVQPITRELAEGLRPFVAGKEPGRPVLAIPTRTALMLRVDLAAAGIPPVDASGRVLDFHALRHSYITHLVRRGVNPKIVQTLARHSTIVLTLDRYCHVEDGDVRGALEDKDASDQHPPTHD